MRFSTRARSRWSAVPATCASAGIGGGGGAFRPVSSPFAILFRVSDGRVTYMQFMEDTFGTAATFRSGCQAVLRADPDGGEAVL